MNDPHDWQPEAAPACVAAVLRPDECWCPEHASHSTAAPPNRNLAASFLIDRYVLFSDCAMIAQARDESRQRRLLAGRRKLVEALALQIPLLDPATEVELLIELVCRAGMSLTPAVALVHRMEQLSEEAAP